MEADIIGMDLAARACFDPAAGKHVFTRLGELEKRMGADRMPSLLRTHPVSQKNHFFFFCLFCSANLLL